MPTKRAVDANADGTDIVLIEADGTRIAMKPGDPRLGKLKVAAFEPPTLPPAPTRADLLALKARVEAALAALPGEPS